MNGREVGFDFPQADIVIGGPMAKLQLHVCQGIRQAPNSAGQVPLC